MPAKSGGRRFAAALLLPFLLLSGAAQGGQFFRCRFDEVVRLSCCCRGEKGIAPEATSIAKPDGCCDVHSVSFDRAPSEPPRFQKATVTAAQPALCAEPAIALAVARPSCPSVMWLAPPRGGAPLVLLNCSLLI